jgi:uncharacterized protein (TIGR03663 family)
VNVRLLFLLSMLAAVALALGLRLPRLAERVMHADEAVQAALARNLWQTGHYQYDPDEFHGPTLPYGTLVRLTLSRASTFAETDEATFRLVTALVGAATVLLVGLLADGLGRAAAVCAALLAAISPAMVFYSRYYIHETLLVFFTLAALACLWRWWQSGRLSWCLAGGAAVGLMQATKETAVLSFAAALGALVLVGLVRRYVSAGDEGDAPAPTRAAWHLLAAAAMAAVVAALAYSSFLSNPRGPIDAVATYLPWLRRAGGESPHIHAWYFYLQRLFWWRPGDGSWWSELLIAALACGGFVASLWPGRRLLGDANRPLVGGLGAYAVLLMLIYTVIPYKTPWCLLQFLLPMTLVAGVGAVALVRAARWLPLRIAAGALIVAAAGQLGWQSYRASFAFPADVRNPYVYGHALPDMIRLGRDVEQLRQAMPQPTTPPVIVVWGDAYYWPIPWYLRGFDRVGYWTHMPDDAAAGIVIAHPQFDDALTERLEATHLMTGYYGVRPGVLAMLWVRMDIWEAHLRRLGRLD